MKTVAIIQARMGSTRLPGKVLLPIGDTNALQMIVKKCKASHSIDQVVVATSENELDKVLQIHCIENDIEFYVGPEDDVLKRVYRAAKCYNADIVVDITADCPLIDLSNLPTYLTHIKQGQYDYVSNVIKRTFPDGLDLQVYTFKALERLEKGTNIPNNPFREHAGWNFTQYTNLYRLFSIEAKKELKWAELRITLDTKEDYILIKKIVKELGTQAKPLEIVNFLKKNPKLLDINSNVKTKQPGE